VTVLLENIHFFVSESLRNPQDHTTNLCRRRSLNLALDKYQIIPQTKYCYTKFELVTAVKLRIPIF